MASDKKSMYLTRDNIKRYHPGRLVFGYSKSCSKHNKLDRIQDHSVILAIQDTTVFNFTLHRKTMGLGPISQAGLSGFFLHSAMAVSTSGVPLGILAHQFWTRPLEPKQSKATHKNRPIEDKESLRWLTLLQKSTKHIPSSTRVVMVGDRESDIFDLLLGIVV